MKAQQHDQLVQELQQENNALKQENETAKQRINSLQILNLTNKHEQHPSRQMNWKQICNAIKHEMSPSLATYIKSILNNQQNMTLIDPPTSSTIKLLLKALKSNKDSNKKLKERQELEDAQQQY